MSDARHHPFASGTQYLDWENRNCCRCTKYSDDASKCELMQALAFACIDDGTVGEDVARRIGYLANRGRYTWECGEKEVVA